MTEKRELKDYLIEEIQESGFPLEIEVSSILEHSQWVVINNKPYTDPDLKAFRTVDVFAFHEPTTYDFEKYRPLAFSPQLILECKKSTTRAWVFFARPKKANVFPMSGQAYDFPKLFSTQGYRNRDKLSPSPFSYEYEFNYLADQVKGMRHIHYADFDNICITYSEYKIRKEKIRDRGKDEIFEAINQIVKSQSCDVKETANHVKDAASPYFPVVLSFIAIVFDGPLFEVTITNGKLELVERDHILLGYRYRPRYSLVDLHYWIDVVERESFSAYLDKIHHDISLVDEKILSNLGSLSTYLKKDRS